MKAVGQQNFNIKRIKKIPYLHAEPSQAQNNWRGIWDQHTKFSMFLFYVEQM